MIKISASSLKDFVVCKATYQFRRMDGISWPRTPPLIKGSAIHETIEKVDRGEIKETDAEDYLQAKLLRDLGSGDVELNPYFRIVKFLESSKEDLASYFEHRKGVILETEKEFEIPAYSPDGADIRLVGKIDQIIDLDGKKCVVDIKTSRNLPTEFEIAGDYQFTFYALAFFMMNGEMPHKIYNFHLGSGKYINYPRDEEDLDELGTWINTMADELHSIDDNWSETDKSKGWHCNRCPYRRVCYDSN